MWTDGFQAALTEDAVGMEMTTQAAVEAAQAAELGDAGAQASASKDLHEQPRCGNKDLGF